ncbi:MAG: hypothetical protein HC905_21110 [Bacteroidales bacterium]|nr:hypothetical protein [Bacteroidales bacterium]
MKNLYLLSAITVFICGSIVGCKNQTNHADGNSANTSLTVDSFLASPDTWAGKEIVISGTVSHVCKHSGKKLFLFSANPEKTVKVNAAGVMLLSILNMKDRISKLRV